MNRIRSKYWLLLVALVVIGLFAYSGFKQNQNSHIEASRAHESEAAETEDVSVASQKKAKHLPSTHAVSPSPQSSQERLFSTLDQNVTQRSYYKALCGTDSFKLKESLGISSDDLDLSFTQLSAIEQIRQTCNDFYEGISSSRWSDSEYEATKSEIELYQMMAPFDSAQENLDIARALLNSDDFRLALDSAKLLLAFDKEFQLQISNSVGSQTSSYAANAANEIIPLLTCKLEGDCGPNSVTMLTHCLGNELACGNSMIGYLLNYHSDSYLSEVLIMSDAIYRMIVNSLQN